MRKTISQDRLFLEKAEEVASASRCRRRQTGCVIVDQNGDYVTGYNRIPKGRGDVCNRCPREGKQHGMWSKQEECPVKHAEIVALKMAVEYGVDTVGATAYVTYLPCLPCAEALKEHGIGRVVFADMYPEPQDVIKFFGENGIAFKYLRSDASV